MESHSDWYRADEDSARSLTPAHKAFEDAVGIFGSRLSKDPRKVATIGRASCMDDVLNAVVDAQSRYNTAHKDSKAGKWLRKLSNRVRLYGKIIDVLVQQHPEYVSLAWGAMNFLFVVSRYFTFSAYVLFADTSRLVVNHEAMTKSLAKGLSQIADSLPRIEISTMIYPTQRMMQTVAELYGRFLIRARDWYQESKLKHALHSFTRPVELRYIDVIKDIKSCKLSVESLASAGAQAEQRDMHFRIQEIEKRQKDSDAVLLDLRQTIFAYQSINTNTFLGMDQRLLDLQISQIMDFITPVRTLDAVKRLHLCAFMRSRHISKSPAQPFWHGTRFRAWKSGATSSPIMVKGSYISRFEIKAFCVEIIESLRESTVPVVWILKTIEQGGNEAPSAIDVLKDLISQVLRLSITVRKEQSLALSCARFRGAETENEWFELLASTLAGLPHIYIILNVEAVGRCYAGIDRSFSWPLAFLSVFRNLSERGLTTVVKVVLVSYGSAVFQNMPQEDLRELVLSVDRPRTTSFAARVTKSSIQIGSASVRGRVYSRNHRRGFLLPS